MAKPLILLQHGWAFNKAVWDSWLPELEEDYNLMVANRGYFMAKHPDVGLTEKMTASIAITHSFGLHLLPMNLFSRLRRLVIISGFQEFHPPVGQERLISERTVQRMMQVLDKDPATVLHEFYRNCFYPLAQEVRISQTFDKPLLLDDLALLNKFSLRLKLLENIPKILILHGANDKIVPVSLGRLLHEKLQQSEFRVCENAGHMVLLTEQEWCLHQVKTFLDS